MDLPGTLTGVIIDPLILWRAQKIELYRISNRSVIILDFFRWGFMPLTPGGEAETNDRALTLSRGGGSERVSELCLTFEFDPWGGFPICRLSLDVAKT